MYKNTIMKIACKFLNIFHYTNTSSYKGVSVTSGSTLVSFKRLTDDKENIEKAIFVSSIIQSIDFHLSFSPSSNDQV